MSLQGVYETQLKNGHKSYRSSITIKNKHVSLGSFSNESEAHRAYTEAVALFKDSRSQIHGYSPANALSFDKWVILINFRDNNLYFSTPIYLMKSYFIYYLSPEIELKFSLDDLFYFSSHKIMKRNGRLFVADYGIQTSLQSRYGIKNYAVMGRDYQFINRDIYDFRFENIKIINSYYGVDCKQSGNAFKYRARIHIRSYYLIGYFDTAVEAAIAYNKAIDIIQKNGIIKNHTPNYIDEIPASEYAEIYNRIVIPTKIQQLRSE